MGTALAAVVLVPEEDGGRLSHSGWWRVWRKTQKESKVREKQTLEGLQTPESSLT